MTTTKHTFTTRLVHFATEPIDFDVTYEVDGYGIEVTDVRMDAGSRNENHNLWTLLSYGVAAMSLLTAGAHADCDAKGKTDEP